MTAPTAPVRGDPPPASGGGGSGGTDELQGEEAELEAQAADLEQQLNSKRTALDQLGLDLDRNRIETDRNKKRIDQRRKRLEAAAERARKAGRKAPDVASDSQIRTAERTRKDLEKRRKDLEKRRKKDEEELKELEAESERVQAELEQARAERAAAQAQQAQQGGGGGGGGGGGAPRPAAPPRVPDYAATGRRVAAALTARRPQAQRDVTTRTEAVTRLEGEVRTLTEQIADADRRITDSTGRRERAEEARQAAQSRLDARRAELRRPPPEGQPAPNPRDDAEVSRLEAEVGRHRTAASRARTDHDTAVADKRRFEEQKRRKEVQLTEARTRKAEAEQKLADLDAAVEQMGTTGCRMYADVIAAFGLSDSLVQYLPPGQDPDDTPEMREMRAREEAQRQERERAERERQRREGDAAYTPPGQQPPGAGDQAQTGPSAAERRAAEEQERQRRVAAARDLPPAQREAELSRLATEYHTSSADLVRRHDESVRATEGRMPPELRAQLGPDTPTSQVEALARQHGLSVAELTNWQTDQRRRTFEAQAARAMGVEGSDPATVQAAADQLRRAAAQRGLASGEAMLRYLADIPADQRGQLPPELRTAAENAAQVRSEYRASLPADAQAAYDGRVTLPPNSRPEAVEGRMAATRSFAAQQGISEDEAARRIAMMAGSMNLDLSQGQSHAEVIRLLSGSQAGPVRPLTDDQRAELDRIRSLPPDQRQAALSRLTSQGVDPRAVLQHQLATQQDTTGLSSTGQVAGDGLRSELARIEAIADPRERMRARMELARATGQTVDQLMITDRVTRTRDDALTRTARVVYDPSLSAEQREAALDRLSRELNIPKERLRSALTASEAETRARLAAAGTTPLGGGGPSLRHDTLDQQLQQIATETLASGTEDRQRRLQELARSTGIPVGELERAVLARQFQHRGAEWGRQLGLEPGPAQELVAREAADRGMTPDQFLNHLRTCPESELSPELREARRHLLADDVANHRRPSPPLSPEQAELQRLRGEFARDGGQYADGRALPQILTPAQIDELERTDPAAAATARAARAEYDRLSSELFDEVYESTVYTSDSRCLQLLNQMSPEQLAQLFRDRPDIRTRLYQGVDDPDARARLERGATYQRMIDLQARVEASPEGQRAAQIERDLRAARAARSSIRGPDGEPASVAETTAHIRAVMAARGVSAEEASRMIVQDPQGTLQAVYAPPPRLDGRDPVAVNDAMRLQLQRIAALPPEQQQTALALLQQVSGYSTRDFVAARRESSRLDRIGRDVAALDGLPPAERQRELERLAQLHGFTRMEGGRRVPDVDRLLALHERGVGQVRQQLERTGAASEIASFVNDPASSLDPGDVRRRAEAIAARTGVPVDTIVGEIDRQRRAATEARITARFGDSAEAQAHLHREAELAGLTPEQFENYLLRQDPARITDPMLLQYRAALIAAGVQPRYTDEQRRIMDEQRLVPGTLAHDQYAAQRDQLEAILDSDGNSDAAMQMFRGMSPAAQRQFLADMRAQGRDPEVMFSNQGGISVDGLIGALNPLDPYDRLQRLQGAQAMIRAADQQDPLAAVEQPFDPSDPAYVERRQRIVTELERGRANRDPAVIREVLAEMSPRERAQFLRDHQALVQTWQRAGVTTGRGGSIDADEDLPETADLASLFPGDPEVGGWLRDAQSINTLDQAMHGDLQAIEDRAAATRRYMEASGIQEPRVAWAAISRMSSDMGVTPRQAAAFLSGDRVEPAEDQPEWLRDAAQRARDRIGRDRHVGEAYQATQAREGQLAGHACDQARVDRAAARLANPDEVPQEELVDLIDGCNPRELSELDRALGGRLSEIVNSRLSGHAGMVNARSRLAQMEQYRRVEVQDRLLSDLASVDPRGTAPLTGPTAVADRIAWIRTLPPERRIEEMNRLTDEASHDLPLRDTSGGADRGYSRELLSAWLNGTTAARSAEVRGADGQVLRQSESAMLTGQLMDLLRSTDGLPLARREAAADELASLLGYRDRGALEQARRSTEVRLQSAQRVAEIRQRPLAEQQAALAELSRETGLPLESLLAMHREAVDAGLVQRLPPALPPDARTELDRIQAIGDEAERRAALERFMSTWRVERADLTGLIQQRSEEERRAQQTISQDAEVARELDRRLADGTPEQVSEYLRRFENDPAALARILPMLGGREELERRLAQNMHQYAPGGGDPFRSWDAFSTAAMGPIWSIYRDRRGGQLLDDAMVIVEGAAAFAEIPARPEAVSQTAAEDYARLLRMPPGEARDRALGDWRAQHPLTESEQQQLDAFAEGHRAYFEARVEAQLARLNNTLRDPLVVEDARVNDIVTGMSPEMLAEVERRYRERFGVSLLDHVRDGVDRNTYAAVEHHVELARRIERLPPEEAQRVSQQMKLDYRESELRRQLALGYFAERDQLNTLLADLSDEEIRELDRRLGPGALEQALRDAATHNVGDTQGFWGPVGSLWASDDPRMLGLAGRVADATAGEQGVRQPDMQRVDEAARRLGELSGDWWNDGAVMDTLTALSPSELVALQQQWAIDHPGQDFEQMLRAELDGDEVARAIGMLRNAEDTVAGVDRRAELRQSARTLAVQERYRELRRDPGNRGKTDEEIYRLVYADQARLEDLTQARIRRIQDAAQSVFAAIDGWGDDTDKLQQTLAGLSVEEIELMRVEYRRHFGRDVDTQIREELSFGNTPVMQRRIENLMSREGRVEGLREYMLSMAGPQEFLGVPVLDEFLSFGGWLWGEASVTEDEEGIYAALQNLTPEERTQVVSGPGGERFLASLTRNLGTYEALVVEALTEINPETGLAEANPAHVAAARMATKMYGSGDWDFWSGWGTDEEGLIAEMDNLTPAQMREAEAWFDRRVSPIAGGDSFRQALGSEVSTTGRDWRIIEAELRGDKVEADVHRLKWAAQDENLWAKVGAVVLFVALFPASIAYAGAALAASAMGYEIPLLDSTDEELLEKTLKAGAEGRGGRGPDHLARVRALFDDTFGQPGGQYASSEGNALDVMLRQETQGVEHAYFEQLGRTGRADPEVELIYAMHGWGTDEERVRRVLERVYEMPRAEREAFGQRFRQASRDLLGVEQSLEEWIADDFGGSEAFEMQLLARGRPRTPAEMREVAELRWSFERDGFWNSIGAGFMDLIEAAGGTHSGEIFERDTAEIFRLVGPDGQLHGGPEAMERLQELSTWQSADAKQYREVRNSYADAVSNTVMAVGAIVTTVVLAIVPGTQALAAAMVAAMISLAAAAAKAAIKGGGYSLEEAGTDLAMAAVAAATAGVGQKLQFAFKGIQNVLLRTMLQKGLEGGMEGFLNAAIQSEDAWRRGDLAFLGHLLKGTFYGAVKGAATGAISHGLNQSGLGRFVDEIDSGAASVRAGFATQLGAKYLNEVLQAAGTTLVDPQNWEMWADSHGLDKSLLRNIFLDSAIQAFGSTAISRSRTFQGLRLSRLQGQLEDQEAGFRQQLAQLGPDHPAVLEAAENLARLRHEYDEVRRYAAGEEVAALRERLAEAEAEAARRASAYREIQTGLRHADPLEPTVDPAESAARAQALQLGFEERELHFRAMLEEGRRLLTDPEAPLDARLFRAPDGGPLPEDDPLRRAHHALAEQSALLRSRPDDPQAHALADLMDGIHRELQPLIDAEALPTRDRDHADALAALADPSRRSQVDPQELIEQLGLLDPLVVGGRRLGELRMDEVRASLADTDPETAQQVLKQLEDAIAEARSNPEVRRRLVAEADTPLPARGENFDAILRSGLWGAEVGETTARMLRYELEAFGFTLERRPDGTFETRPLENRFADGWTQVHVGPDGRLRFGPPPEPAVYGNASAVPESRRFRPGAVEDVWGEEPQTAQQRWGERQREAAHHRQLDEQVDHLLDGPTAPAGVHRDGPVLVIDVDGQPAQATVRAASRQEHAEMLAAGQVARYRVDAHGRWEITVVPGLHPLMVQRALAHEIAEIREVSRAIRATGAATRQQVEAVIASQRVAALSLDVDPSGVVRPTAHDAGRLAEMLVLHGQKDVHPRIVEEELRALATHLGLTDPTVHEGTTRSLGELRMAAVEEHVARQVAAGALGREQADAFLAHLRGVVERAAADPRLRQAPRPDDPGRRLDAGVELHSHFLGIPSVDDWLGWTGKTPLELLQQVVGVSAKDYDEKYPTSGARVLAEARRLVGEVPGPDAPPEVRAAHAKRVREVLGTLMGAGQHVPFDASYEIRDHLIKTSLDPEHATRGYVEFSAMALYALLKDGIHYTEQSQSLKKLTANGPGGQGMFSPHVMAEARQRVMQRLVDEIAANPDDPRPVRMLRLLAESEHGTRWLAMITTGHLAGLQKLKPEDVERLRGALQRHDVAGIDVAAPEQHRFETDEDGNNPTFRQVYRIAAEEAEKKGQPLAMRPHVGEGYGLPPTDPDALHDRDRPPTRDGVPVHYDTAHHNLKVLVDTLDAMAAAGELSDDVVVRFGHATHADADVASRMAKHGVYAEVNLSSNVQTAAIVQPGRSVGAEAIDGDTPLHGRPGHVPTTDDHGLLTLIANGAKVVLSTDAQGVMHTTLAREYQFASEVVEAFLRGATRVPIRIGDQEVEVTWKQIQDALAGRPSPVPPEVAAEIAPRFRDPIGDMQRNAHEYERRITGADRALEPPPTPTNDAPNRGPADGVGDGVDPAVVSGGGVDPDAGPVGTASAVRSFHGSARGQDDHEAVAGAVQRSIADLSAAPPAGLVVDPDGGMRIALPGRPEVPVRIEVVPSGSMKDGAVAQYRFDPDGAAVIQVSAGAVDHHVARALAHEVAEIRALVRDGRRSIEGDIDELVPGNVKGVDRLSAHDEGRIAELQVLTRQLENLPEGVDRGVLEAELRELVGHLGLQEGGDKLARARELLGSSSPEYQRLYRFLLGEEGVDRGALPVPVAGDGATPLKDPVREAELSAAADALWAVQNTGLDRVDPKPLLKALTGLDGKAEVDRLLFLYRTRYAPDEASLDAEGLGQVLSKHLKPRDWYEAVAHLGGDPVVAAERALLNAINARSHRSEADEALPADGGPGTMGWARALLSWRKAGAAAVRSSLLVDQERVFEILGRLKPAQRQKLAQSDSGRAVLDAVSEKLPKTGAIRHKFDAFQFDETDLDLQAGYTAARLYQALHGSGQWRDLSSKLGVLGTVTGTDFLSNRAELKAVLDQLSGDPALYRRVLQQYATMRGSDDPSVLHADVAAVTARREWNVLDAVSTLSLGIGSWAINLLRRGANTEIHQSDRHARQAMLLQLQKCELELRYEDDVFAGLRKLDPSRRPSASELAEWVALIREGGAVGALLESALQDAGVDLWRLAAYVQEAAPIERDQWAHRTLAEAKAGRFEATLAQLEDRTHVERRKTLQDLLDAGDLEPEQQALVRQRMGELDAALSARRQAQDEALRRASTAFGGREEGVAELIERRFGDTDAEQGQLGVAKGRWLHRAWESGGLEPHEQLFLAIRGAGVDVPRALAALKGRSPEQIRAIAQRFHADFGDQSFYTVLGMLRHPVDALRGGAQGKKLSAEAFLAEALKDFGGRTGEAVLLAAKGDPATVFDPRKPPDDPQKRKEQAARRLALEIELTELEHDLERDGVGRRIADANEGVQARFGWKVAAGRRLDAVNEEIRAFVDDPVHKAALLAGDPDTWVALETLRKRHQSAAAAAGAYRDALAKDAKSLVGGLVTVATVVATAGFGVPAASLALAGTGSKLGGVAVDRVIRGKGMSQAELLKELAGVGLGLATGGVLDATGVTAVLKAVPAGLPSAEVVGGGMAAGAKGVGSALGKAAVDPTTHRGDDRLRRLTDKAAGDTASDVVGAVAKLESAAALDDLGVGQFKLGTYEPTSLAEDELKAQGSGLVDRTLYSQLNEGAGSAMDKARKAPPSSDPQSPQALVKAATGAALGSPLTPLPGTNGLVDDADRARQTVRGALEKMRASPPPGVESVGMDPAERTTIEALLKLARLQGDPPEEIAELERLRDTLRVRVATDAGSVPARLEIAAPGEVPPGAIYTLEREGSELVVRIVSTAKERHVELALRQVVAELREQRPIAMGREEVGQGAFAAGLRRAPTEDHDGELRPVARLEAAIGLPVHVRGADEAPAVVMLGDDEAALTAARWLRPEPGVTQVVVHGDGDKVVIEVDGVEVELGPAELADHLKRIGVKGPVRLVSCGAGADEGYAAELARRLGVPVTAPTDTVWIHGDGRMTVGASSDESTGAWRTFDANGRLVGAERSAEVEVRQGRDAELEPIALGRKGPPLPQPVEDLLFAELAADLRLDRLRTVERFRSLYDGGDATEVQALDQLLAEAVALGVAIPKVARPFREAHGVRVPDEALPELRAALAAAVEEARRKTDQAVERLGRHTDPEVAREVVQRLVARGLPLGLVETAIKQAPKAGGRIPGDAAAVERVIFRTLSDAVAIDGDGARLPTDRAGIEAVLAEVGAADPARRQEVLEYVSRHLSDDMLRAITAEDSPWKVLVYSADLDAMAADLAARGIRIARIVKGNETTDFDKIVAVDAEGRPHLILRALAGRAYPKEILGHLLHPSTHGAVASDRVELVADPQYRAEATLAPILDEIAHKVGAAPWGEGTSTTPEVLVLGNPAQFKAAVLAGDYGPEAQAAARQKVVSGSTDGVRWEAYRINGKLVVVCGIEPGLYADRAGALLRVVNRRRAEQEQGGVPVVMVGTAGALDPDLQKMDVVVPERLGDANGDQVDPIDHENQALALVRQMALDHQLDLAPGLLAGGQHGAVDSILTETPEWLGRMRGQIAIVEQEAADLARAAKEGGSPLFAVFRVSDQVGSEDESQRFAAESRGREKSRSPFDEGEVVREAVRALCGLPPKRGSGGPPTSDGPLRLTTRDLVLGGQGYTLQAWLEQADDLVAEMLEDELQALVERTGGHPTEDQLRVLHAGLVSLERRFRRVLRLRRT